LGVIAYYYRNLAEALDYHQRALEIRQAVGDRNGEGMSLLSFAQVNLETGDYVQAEHNYLAALSIQQAIGDRWDEVNTWNGLGILYQDLGDWSKAQTCLEQGLELSQAIGDEAGQAYILVNLGPVVRDQGDLVGAEKLLTEGLLIAQAQSDKRLISSFYSYLGAISLQAGNLEQAIERASTALAMRRKLDMHLWTTADLTTIAAAHLARGEKSKALNYAQQAMTILDECQGKGPEFPQQDYFICYQVLATDGQTEAAQAALKSAYSLVMARAEKITDLSLRQSFLEQVPINRQIVQEVQKVGT